MSARTAHRCCCLRSSVIVFGILGGWLAAAATLAAQSEKPASKPNFVIIVADDMGFSDAGCYGGEIETPNLDRLANNGLRYTQMYSTGRCWPSRACLLTGYYAQQVRMDPPRGRLPEWARVLPHYLKPLGYRSYHSGKWHLHGAPKRIGDAGFDRSYSVEDHDRFFGPRRHLLDDQPLPAVEPGTDFYVTRAIADYAIDFLKQHTAEHGGQPFFLYLAFTAPHFPLHAPQADIDKYRRRYEVGWDVIRQQRWERMRQMGIINCRLPPPDTDVVPSWNLPAAELTKRIGPGEAAQAVAWEKLTRQQQEFQAVKMAIHAAMVDAMDRQIGRVLEQLRAMRAEDNTVIMFVSDNGASAEQIIRGDGHDPAAPPGSASTFLCLGPGWSTASNAPFRLHKHWVHEGGIASPFIVSWPAGLRQRGSLRHTPAHFIDLLPTVLELAGVEPPEKGNAHNPPPLPGRSLVPSFEQDVVIRREYLYWHHMTHRAIRVDNWKLVSAGRKGSYGDWELYDLAADRAETVDLAQKHPDVVKRLADLWQKCEDQFRSQAGTVAP